MIILLPLASIMGKMMGINGIWWSFLISETVTVVFAIIYLGIAEKERTVISGLYAAGTEYSRIMADLEKNESDEVMERDLIIICEHIQ